MRAIDCSTIDERGDTEAVGQIACPTAQPIETRRFRRYFQDRGHDFAKCGTISHRGGEKKAGQALIRRACSAARRSVECPPAIALDCQSGYRITTSGQNSTTRESTRPRIDGENRTKRLGMLVALPGHQATVGLSSE
jgi:hypothetical protein